MYVVKKIRFHYFVFRLPPKFLTIVLVLVCSNMLSTLASRAELITERSRSTYLYGVQVQLKSEKLGK
jgi:hypothetical protein